MEEVLHGLGMDIFLVKNVKKMLKISVLTTKPPWIPSWLEILHNGKQFTVTWILIIKNAIMKTQLLGHY